LLKQSKVEEFKELLGIVKNPALVAKVLLVFPKEIAKREKMPLNLVEEKLTKDVISNVLDNLKRKKISEGDVKNVLAKIVRGEDFVKAVKVRKAASMNDVEAKIMSFIKEKPGLSMNAYMGLVMKEFKGGVDGKIIMEIIKKYVG